MKSIFTKTKIQLLVMIFIFSLTRSWAQCGTPPVATHMPIQCYGGTTTVLLSCQLLGGPYNIQPYLDYQFPQIPIGAYATNYAAPTYTLTGQTAGTYTIYVVDVGHGNCYDSATFTISQPNLLNFSNGMGSPYTCAGQVTASYNMAGGTPPYTISYTQDGTNFLNLTTTASTTYNTNLNLGAYAYKLTDANGCIVDQSATFFGHAPGDQSHWYIGMCGATDSAVSFLTGGNMTVNRNIDLLMQGLGAATDNLKLDVDYGDASAIQSFTRTVATQMNTIPLNHTYTATGVYKITYSAINLTHADTVQVVEFINANSDVWPGDANGDGVANNFDLLQVGLGFGSTGNVRAGATNNWNAEACVDWTQFFTSGENYKHADCDGNGTIGYSDTTAISLNYGQTHVLKLSQADVFSSPTDPTLQVNFPSGIFNTGTPVTIPITLGSNTVPANNFYGIAFTINYPLNAFNGNSAWMDYSNCFMGALGTSTLKVDKNFAANGSIDVAVSLNNQTNMSGFGTVAELNIITIDNVSGKFNSNITEYITLSNVRFIDKNGNNLAFNTQKDSISIAGTVGAQEISYNSNTLIYPNPAHDKINIYNPEKITDVMIMDLSGRMMQRITPNANSIELNTNELASGIYIVKCITGKGITERKIQIEK